MGLGYRVFIVAGDELVGPISQRTFQDFYFGGKSVLRQYAGQMIDLATAFYETRNRRPARVFRVDVLRCQVSRAGKLDERHHREALRLAVSLLGELSVQGQRAENVIDALARFEKRRREARHAPKLSGPALKKILASLIPSTRP